MTKFNTGNPVGSSDPRDLSDNASVADNLVTGEAPAYNDRRGKSRKSWQGMEDEFAAFIAASGYEFVGDYAAGIEITGYNQVVRDTGGEFWRVSGSTALPYTTTGAGLPEGGAFVAVGDAALRQELNGPISSGQGATLVKGATIEVASVAELEALSLPAGRNVYLTQEDRAGDFVVKTGTPPSDPQKGIYIVLANGNYAERQYLGAVSVKWFGAKGDGITDDSVSIDRTIKLVNILGGGIVYLPEGVYLMGTTTDATTLAYYLYARDNVSLCGDGMDVSFIKVKDGENEKYKGTNGPYILATAQSEPLKNVRVFDLTFDWNGKNNLLGEPGINGETSRNNASIFSLRGAKDIIIERVHIKETPGDQCIFFPAQENLGQGNITIRDCIFTDSGSGLLNNYNFDHSSIFCNGDNLLYERNTFLADREVFGSCYELHGSNSRATGNVSNNYRQGFWIATNYESISNINVYGDIHSNVSFAYALSSPVQEIGSVSVKNCAFSQSGSISHSGTNFFVNGNTVKYCRKLEMSGNLFLGAGYGVFSFMQHQRIEDLILRENEIKGFESFGILSSNLSIGGARVVGILRIENNDWKDVKFPVYFNSPGLSADCVIIEGNNFDRTLTENDAAITLNIRPSRGVVANNSYSESYNSVYAGNFNGIMIEDSFVGTYTPEVSGDSTPGSASYSVQQGEYKVSDGICTVRARVDWSGHTGVGNITISLPLPVKAGSIRAVGSAIMSNYAFSGYVISFADAPNTYARLSQVISGSSQAFLPLEASGSATITIEYRAY